jgi:hypothetical protein
MSWWLLFVAAQTSLQPVQVASEVDPVVLSENQITRLAVAPLSSIPSIVSNDSCRDQWDEYVECLLRSPYPRQS